MSKSPDCHNPSSKVDKLLTRGIRLEPPELNDWSGQVLDQLQDADPKDLQHIASDLLLDLPYDQIIEAAGQKGGRARGVLQDNRHLMMAGRDALIVASNHNLDERYDSLRTACWGIGQIVDKLDNRDTYKKTMAACADLASGIPAPQSPAKPGKMLSRVESRLGIVIDDLINPGDLEGEEYHRARIGFRRISNTAVVQAFIDDSPELATFASEGVALSHQFGQIKNDKIAAEAVLPAYFVPIAYE